MRSKSIGALAAVTAVGIAAALGVVSASPAASGGPAKVVAHASRYGKVLFDGRGRVLYLFACDRGRTSSCYGACAKAWPPLLTTGKPSAGAGARRGLLGTTRRKHGSLQVTYAGHPLYRFVGDKKPGQITCQNVSNFGGKWLVVTPAGKAVR